MKIKCFLLVLTSIVMCANKVRAFHTETDSLVIDGIAYSIVIEWNDRLRMPGHSAAYVIANKERPYSGEVILPNEIIHPTYTVQDEPFYITVAGIDLDAFRFNTNITSVRISAKCREIPAKVFEGCSSLSSIVVDPKNEVFDSRNNCNALIISKGNEGDWLYTGCKNTIIPEDVNYIFSNSFSMCSGLTSINIPDGVKKIGFNAFYDCKRLTTLDTKNVSTIGENAFYGCSSLTMLTIRNASTIGNGAFSNCQKLTDVFCYTNTVPSGFASAFDDSASNTILYVHDYLVKDFKELGLPFKEIVPIEGDNPTNIAPIHSEESQKVSYNLNGINVTKANNTGKGIIIRDGKKYYIR